MPITTKFVKVFFTEHPMCNHSRSLFTITVDPAASAKRGTKRTKHGTDKTTIAHGSIEPLKKY